MIISFKMVSKRQKTIFSFLNKVPAKQGILIYNLLHRDIFLDYDKIIDIYASKYPRMMLLVNPLSEN